MAEANGDTGLNGASPKPSVLIIGGLGYIGRFLAHYIYTNHLCSHLRLVDKVLPQLAHLAPEFKEVCSQSNFLQADASRETSMSRIFDHPDGKDWDYVFNLGGETAWAQSAEIYRIRSVQLSVTLGKEAAKRNVRAFVECSTGMVYAPDRKPRSESDKLKPWLNLAKAKLDAERELSKIPGLNLVILRPAHVYGAYDSGFVAKALCLARVYQDQQRELKWLWSEDLRINTVHVSDVARALWTAAEWRSVNDRVPSTASPTSSRRPTLIGGHKASKSSVSSVDAPALNGAVPVFNIVDHGCTSQGTLASCISKVFSIKTGFQGSIISQFAKLNLESVVDDLNDDILQPWADMLAQKGLASSGKLSPFLEKELLKDTDLSLDGALFERVTGFQYDRGGGLSEDGVREMVSSYEKMGWWP